ncbi:MAG: threonine/serine exporter family protein [Negativicutes bacterium]|jgi:uncharacterized membrane protein YjjP (DUF1212 family)
MITERSDNNDLDFTTKAISLLAKYGASVIELQKTASRLMLRFLKDGEYLVMSGAFCINYGVRFNHKTVMVPLTNSELNVSKLQELTGVVEKVADGECSSVEGLIELSIVDAKKPLYGKLLTVFGWAMSSFGVAIIFGSNWQGAIVATVISVVAAMINLNNIDKLKVLGNPLAAFFAVIIAVGLTDVFGNYSVPLVIVCGLITLMPGFSLTQGISEIAHSHIVSGSARLMSALITLLMLAVGVFIGYKVVGIYSSIQPGTFSVTPGSWEVIVIATAIVMISLGIMFNVSCKRFGAIVVVGILATLTMIYGGKVGGCYLGAGAATFVLIILGNGYARWRKCGAAIIKVPCIMVLVPGSVGFNGVISMLSTNMESGMETGLMMMMTAVSLVVGGLLADGIFPQHPRQKLT